MVCLYVLCPIRSTNANIGRNFETFCPKAGAALSQCRPFPLSMADYNINYIFTNIFSQITTNFTEDMGHLVLRGAIMRKFILFAAGGIAAVTVLLSTGAAVKEPSQGLNEVEEQVILRLLHHPTVVAVDDYYGEHRQYWRQEVHKIQKVPESPYYEVMIQAETFCGAHNPPYGLETITFYIGPLGEVQLINFDHQDEAE